MWVKMHGSLRGVEEVMDQVIRAVREVIGRGLIVGTAGNISSRIPEDKYIVITPTAYKHVDMKRKDLVIVDMNGNIVKGKRKPSTELKLHLKIYSERSDVSAIIHTHSKYACVLAVCRMKIPVILDEMIQKLGGEIDVAEYALPGSIELAENAVKALKDKNAVLLANHGVVSCGKNMDEALENALLVERVAEIYVFSQLIGKTKTLPMNSIEVQSKLYMHRLKLNRYPS